MVEDHGRGQNGADAAAHAIYTPFMLSLYDRLIHGLSNRFAWRCPTELLLDLYRTNLSGHHLEAGVGTGSSSIAPSVAPSSSSR